ncbi:MAG: phage protein Gp27 family protein [Sedimentisphaerales bacterium]
MAQRRTHSSLDKLPASLKDELIRMLVDNEYPIEFAGDKTGKPKYEDIVAYCKQRGHIVSRSAVGRFGMTMRTISRMKQAGLITREVMKGLTDEKASATQKAVAEMVTAVGIEFISSNETFTAKEISEVAKAIKDCAAVAIASDKYTREQLTKKVAAATESTKAKLTKAGVDRKLIQEIIDEHLGVVKS